MINVAGHCPQGCGETLFVGAGGHITCSWIKCPNPTSVDELLDQHDPEHYVTVDVHGVWAIQHPIAERVTLHGNLMLCPLHDWMRRLKDVPLEGKYQATKGRRLGWNLQKVPA